MSDNDQWENEKRKIGQGLSQSRKKRLCQKPCWLLFTVKFIGNEGAVGFHGCVVACIENPEQAGSHPEF
jgi:hypothetical protein